MPHINGKIFSCEEVEKILKGAVEEFLLSLESITPENKIFLLNAAICALKISPSTKVGHVCRCNLLPNKNIIKSRDESFILEHLHNLFGEFPEVEVNYVAEQWRNGILKKEHKEHIWAHMDVIMKLTEGTCEKKLS